MMNLAYTGERMIPEKSDPVTFWEHIFRYKFAKKFAKGKEILDIACGEGYGTAALTVAGPKSIIGIDISVEACQHAMCRYGIKVIAGRAEEIPFKANSLDLIVSFETLEHIAHPADFIKESARVLRENGKIILSTPNKLVFNSPEVYGDKKKDNPFHIHEFDQLEFLDFVSRYFKNFRLYMQWPKTMAWWNLQSLSSYETPWLSLRGMWKLRRFLREKTCPYLWEKPSLQGTLDASKLISLNDPLLSSFVNPYLIRRWNIKRDEPRYFIVVGSLKK